MARLVPPLVVEADPGAALARAREDLDHRELAIACASHRRAGQLDAVRRLLADAPARERSSSAGSRRVARPTRSTHNCSGKHAGHARALPRARLALRGYRHEAHRVQRAMAAAHAETAGVDEDSMPSAIDGCGVVTFALSLELTARAFGRLANSAAASACLQRCAQTPSWWAAPARRTPS